MTNSRGWILAGVLVAMLVAACGDNRDKPAPDAAPDSNDLSQVQRGEYIVNVLGACSFCHTPLLPNGSRDLDRLLAGVDCFVDLDGDNFMDNMNGSGCLSTRNLTPHATGLGNATDEQIKNAFQNGMRTDGKKITPIMPWYIFHNLTDDDADAIVAYLRSIPPVDHQVKANEPPFSLFNDGVPLPMPFDEWANVVPLLDHEIPLPIGGTNNASAMNGRYLTTAAGLCIDCHTPEVAPFGIRLDMSKAMAGGKVFPKEQLGLVDTSNAYPPVIATRNLTQDPTGLGGWSKMQIKLAIAEGRDRDNKAVCAATHGGFTSPYAGLTESDLDDIVEYLALLPGVENDTANDTAAANCGPPVYPLPVLAPETGADCGNSTDDDGDSVPDDGCPETGAECANAVDDDADGQVNDGCLYPCGDCQGPTVP